MKEDKTSGITLVSLVITIVVIVIITGISITTGLESIKNTKMTSFMTELEMIQEKVNTIYEKRKLNKEDITYYDGLGQDISVIGSEKLAQILNGKNQEEYRYFSKQDLKQLDLDNVTQDVVINFNSRDIASVNGLLLDGKVCYRLIDIPSYRGHSIEYNNKNINAPIFDIEVSKLIETWQITIKSNNSMNNLYGGTLSYKRSEDENWILLGETSYFEVTKTRSI